MASEELATVLGMLRSVDLGALTIVERRAATDSVAAQPPPGISVEQTDAGGVPAEWVVAEGVPAGNALLYFHGGGYQIGSPATLRHMIALLSAAAQARVLSVDYRLAPDASPLYADLRGLPSILLHVGEAEVVLDDSTRFAAKAHAAGVDVILEIWPEMPHVWHAFAGLLPESDWAIERIGSWLRARWSGARPAT